MLTPESIRVREILLDEGRDGEYWIENDHTPRTRELQRAAVEAVVRRFRGRRTVVHELLEPTGFEAFFRDVWQETPLLVRNNHNPRYFRSLFSAREMADGVASGRYRRQHFRFIQGKRQIDEEPFFRRGPEDHPDPGQIRDFLHKEGGSLVLDDLYHYHPPVARLWHRLMDVFRFPVTCTAYHTPAGAQTFQTHWDTDDVFVLQIDGPKRWVVCPPMIRSPLAHHSYNKYELEEGEALVDHVLRPGELLYVPRGFIHRVAALEEAPSVHITVGVSVPDWHTLLKLFLRRVLLEWGQELESRQPAPLLHLLEEDGADPELLDTFRAEVRSFADALRGRLTPGSFRAAIEDFMMEQSKWGLPEVAARGPDPAPELGVDSELRRPTQLDFLYREGDAVTLKFGGKCMTLSGRLWESLRFVRERERFRVGEIPGDLSDRDRITLARRLCQERYLEPL